MTRSTSAHRDALKSSNVFRACEAFATRIVALRPNRIRTILLHAGASFSLWHPPSMPQSLSAVYIHLVFSTKDRRPLLHDKPTRDALHSYLGGVSKQLDCPPILVGGVEDHAHLLARFGRTITQAEWVKELKRVSNIWLKERGRDCADFEWQGGYANFSVSQSNLEQSINPHRFYCVFQTLREGTHFARFRRDLFLGSSSGMSVFRQPKNPRSL